MKQLILIFFLFFSMQCFSQVKDTTAKAPDNYYLIGGLPLWQMMYKAVKEPNKITREEEATLLAWMANIQKIPADTTKQKKPNK